VSEYLIAGERVALGVLRRDLAATYATWINRAEVRHGVVSRGIYDAGTEGVWIDDMLSQSGRLEPTAAPFTIHDRRDDEPVGTCMLTGIDYRHARCGFGILLGERRGQGLGTEATRLALDWAFNALSLRNVLLEVMPWNAAAIRTYEKAGFRHIGRRRDALLLHGRRWDELYMDAVADEFTGSVLPGVET
jgi:RimJ/RimL family protein N-acetyltransferase